MDEWTRVSRGAVNTDNQWICAGSEVINRNRQTGNRAGARWAGGRDQLISRRDPCAAYARINSALGVVGL